MSITITTDVSCDHCGQRVFGTTGTKPQATEARTVLAKAGWKRIKVPRQPGAWEDVCPNCARPIGRPDANAPDAQREPAVPTDRSATIAAEVERRFNERGDAAIAFFQGRLPPAPLTDLGSEPQTHSASAAPAPAEIIESLNLPTTKPGDALCALGNLLGGPGDPIRELLVGAAYDLGVLANVGRLLPEATQQAWPVSSAIERWRVQ